MAWTEERIEILKKLWLNGLSASQVAAKLGEVTRNAVIGKVHRLGLSGRSKTGNVSTSTQKIHINDNKSAHNKRTHTPKITHNFTATKDIENTPPTSTDINVSNLSLEKRSSILNLTEYTCKWPIGDPSEKSFHFCSAKSTSDTPYCEEHAQKAYQSTDRRKQA